MFKNKKKKYGNGPKIGRNPPLMENSILFFFFIEPFPKSLVFWRRPPVSLSQWRDELESFYRRSRDGEWHAGGVLFPLQIKTGVSMLWVSITERGKELYKGEREQNKLANFLQSYRTPPISWLVHASAGLCTDLNNTAVTASADWGVFSNVIQIIVCYGYCQLCFLYNTTVIYSTI